ncbi:LolA family protein [Georgenia subflava]|uniref:DUF2092 domain-containing protein n=1 Tax=Georgenia subflava TaxID=1622177 RepID=A0A6N7EK20_9MICO|nr:DUF2092 domain-containing protein [Georgenia subflava]MPV37137.1 DUF2092 domain-containing protein [Georgenia subflava]
MARWYRWLPAAAVPAVVGAVAITSTAGAADLPDKSPEEILAMMGEHSVEAFSGSFEQTSDLGLPELPGGLAGDDADAASQALELVTGSHTGRVYVGEADTMRVQVMDAFAERDLVVNGQDAWVYDSADNSALHLTLPERVDGRAHEMSGDVPTPQELAEHVVDAVEPSTELTVAQDVSVAGRDAYELVLTPRTDATLVGSVAIAVDGETGFPLRVTVNAVGQEDPAFELGYTSFDLGEPAASLFEFTPPAGADVEEKTVPDLAGPGAMARPAPGTAPHGSDKTGPHRPDTAAPHGPHPSDGSAPMVDGEGWESVVVLPTADELTSDPMLAQLTRAVDGGRLLSTALVNVLVTDDGRVLIGSVTLERLQAVAGS